MKKNWKNLGLGETVLLGSIVAFPVPELVETIASDWDWLWLDSQHGMLDGQSMRSCVLACNMCKTACVVRVPSLNSGDILHALDAGADGVMVPMVETVAQAQEAVRAAKFPPLGIRSFGSPRLIVRHGPAYAETANEDTLLVVQIETARGMKNIEAIAGVPGVDVLLLGPYDLALSMGNSPQNLWQKDFIKDQLKIAADAVKKHNKILGAFLANNEDVIKGIQSGCTLIAATTDLTMIKNESEYVSKSLRNIRNMGGE